MSRGRDQLASDTTEPGLVGVAADARRRLDVLGGVLRLADHQHQAEPGHVDADLQHGGGEHDVVRLRSPQGGGCLLGLAWRRVALGGSRRVPRVLQRSLLNGSESLSRVLEISSAEIREVSSPISSRVQVVRAPRERLGVAGDARGDVVVEVAAHAGQLPRRAEVADGGQVGVGRVAVLVEELLPGEQQHLGDPDLGEGQPDAVGADAEVLPAGCSSVTSISLEKKVSRTSSTCGGNTSTPRPYSARTWSSGVPHGRGRRDDRADGSSCRPASYDDSRSTAFSKTPTAVPSAPVMRWSSSWMIRSGGRSRSTGWTVTLG